MMLVPFYLKAEWIVATVVNKLKGSLAAVLQSVEYNGDGVLHDI